MADEDNLTLQINKVVTSVDNNRVEYNASERGKVLEVKIVGTNHVALDLTGKTLRFVENKTGGKIVIDDQADKGNEKDGAGIFTILDAKSGRFAYQYSRYIYQASGEAWFEVYSDSDHIDTTQKFYIDIENGTLLDVQNDNYISSLQAEIASYKATNQRLNEESDAQLNALKAKIQQSENMTDKAKSDAITAINEVKNTATTTLNKINGQYNSYLSKYQALESQINNDCKTINDNAAAEINSIKADWSKQTDAINADAKTKIDAAIAAVETARDNAIKQAVSDFSNQCDNLQADYNSWKQQTVNDFTKLFEPLKTEITTDRQDLKDISDQIAATKKEMVKLSNQLDSIDLTKFVTDNQFKEAMAKKASGLKVRGLRGDYVLAVDTTTSNIDGTPAGNSGSGLVDSTVLAGVMQTISDAILGKNHYTKVEVDNLLKGVKDQLTSLIEQKADTTTLTKRANALAQQIDDLQTENSNLKNVNTQLQQQNDNLQKQVTKLTPVHVSSVDDVARQDSFFVIVDD